MKSPVCLSGPRPPRPRWRSQGRRRSTTQRSRPQRSGGRRQGGFLVSRGMRDPGSPGDLSPGVVTRGPGATCRVGWSRRGRKLPDAIAARRSRRSRPSARSSQERTRGTQSPDRPRDDLGHTPPTQGLHLCRATNAPTRRPLSAHSQRPVLPLFAPRHRALARPDRASTSTAFLGQARPLLACCSLRRGPGERNTMPRSTNRRRPSLRRFRPEWAFSSAFCASGIEPKGSKRRSRFERSRRARAAGRRRIPPDPARLVQPCTAGGKTPKDTRRTAYGALGWEFNGWIAPTVDLATCPIPDVRHCAHLSRSGSRRRHRRAALRSCELRVPRACHPNGGRWW